MSQANIPNITPNISITIGQSTTLLLASIALEELALAHIVNSEAEKIQFVLGTLGGSVISPNIVTISNLIEINKSVQETLDTVIKKEMLLQTKLSNIVNLIEKI
ncbi:hypothetical protein ACLBXI_20685 [Bacillus cereus]